MRGAGVRGVRGARAGIHAQGQRGGPRAAGGAIDQSTDPRLRSFCVGGVFKSDNDGVSFVPVFRTYSTSSIGDDPIHPRDPDIVYIGTGEANARQASSFGGGISETTHGRTTWNEIVD